MNKFDIQCEVCGMEGSMGCKVCNEYYEFDEPVHTNYYCPKCIYNVWGLWQKKKDFTKHKKCNDMEQKRYLLCNGCNTKYCCCIREISHFYVSEQLYSGIPKDQIKFISSEEYDKMRSKV